MGRIAAGTGVATSFPGRRSRDVQGAMENAALSAAQEGEENPRLIRRRMMAARQRVRHEVADRVAVAMREALEDLNVRRMLDVWEYLYPNLPQPGAPDAIVVLHQARTGAESLELPKRLYSHAWLAERQHRSALPMDLRPAQEINGSVIVPAVGVSVNSMSSRRDRVEEAVEIEAIMAAAAGEMVDAGITDKAQITAHMWARREAFLAGRFKSEL